jgi:hypothetical protein
VQLTTFANAYAERLIGSIRWECLNHFIILNTRHLKKTLAAYFRYYHRSRTRGLVQRPIHKELTHTPAKPEPVYRQNGHSEEDTRLSKGRLLKLIASTGLGNASIDVAAAGDHGIAVVHTGYRSDPTIEFTWALISEHPMRSRYFSPVTIAATLRERNCSSTAVSRKANLYETSK